MRRIHLPLFWKFTIAIVIIVALFGSINLYILNQSISRSLGAESEKRGIFIAQQLASLSVNPLLYEDYIAIQSWIEDIVKIDSSIAYVFVWDKQNNIIIHNFTDTVPGSILHANHLNGTQTESIRLLEVVDRPDWIIRDIAVPVLSPEIGVVRVGIRENSLMENVNTTMRQLLMMVFIFLVFGILGALFFSHVITHPIRSISEIAEGIDLDSLRYKKHPRVRIREKLFGKFPMIFRATDELDVLTEKFNAMIERLENAHQELEAAYAQLVQSEKLASLGTLSAGLAHEINNPIAGIQNCLRRLKQNPQNVAQAKKYLELMEEATNRIATVVRSLLDYARPREMDFAPVNIEEVIETALLLVAYKLEKHRIAITKEVPPDVPPIHASRHHLEQVMVNLLLNAIDAIEERFLQSQTASKSIHIGVKHKQNTLEIFLKDSGIGIPQENLSKIFDPFYTTKDIGKGTGMGLSVCYNIIIAHGGNISVSSKLNRGTTFYITLPLSPQLSSRGEKSVRNQKVGDRP